MVRARHAIITMSWAVSLGTWERKGLGAGQVVVTMTWQYLRVPGKRVGLGQGMQ